MTSWDKKKIVLIISSDNHWQISAKSCYMYIIGAFSNGVCYDLQSLGYNVGHGLSVVHGPFYGLPLDLP